MVVWIPSVSMAGRVFLLGSRSSSSDKISIIGQSSKREVYFCWHQTVMYGGTNETPEGRKRVQTTEGPFPCFEVPQPSVSSNQPSSTKAIDITVNSSCIVVSHHEQIHKPKQISMETMAERRKELVLISSEGEEYHATWPSMKISKLIAEMVDDEDGESIQETECIPLPNVKSADLSRTIEFCSHYEVDPMLNMVKPLQDSDLSRLVQPWYFHFIDRVSNDEIFQLTMAANYLHIQPLLDLCFAKIASGIKGKTPEEIRANLGIEVDFSQEEEAKIRMENSWADSTT